MTRIFPQGFSSSFGSGACYAVDAPIDAGMSGGPVFNDDGYVCGLNSSTDPAEEGSSLIAALYPALLTPIPYGLELANGQVRFRQSRLLIDLIGSGAIESDGSEERVHFHREGDRWRIGPMIHEDDSDRVFEGGHAFLENRKAVPEENRGFALRRTRDGQGGG